MALEQLLTKRATMGFQCRELEVNTELAECLNDAEAAKAIRKAEVHCKNATCALQQAHRDSVLVLEYETKVAEEQNCQAFTEAFRAAM